MANKLLTITLTADQSLALTQLALLCTRMQGGAYVLSGDSLATVRAAGAAWQAAVESQAQDVARRRADLSAKRAAAGRTGGQAGGKSTSEAKLSALAANRARRWVGKESEPEIAIAGAAEGAGERER